MGIIGYRGTFPLLRDSVHGFTVLVVTRRELLRLCVQLVLFLFSCFFIIKTNFNEVALTFKGARRSPSLLLLFYAYDRLVAHGSAFTTD